MTSPRQSDEITEQLRRFSATGVAEPELVSFLYAELKKVAVACLRSERTGHTLQPTALVNEVFLKVLKRNAVDYQNRSHFFAVAAQTMRRVLVDYARSRKALRRGAGAVPVKLDDNLAFHQTEYDTILAVNDALDSLKELNERQAHIVELRFFAGLTEEEIADLLQVSSRTVKRDWTAARAWLHAELSGDTPAD